MTFWLRTYSNSRIHGMYSKYSAPGSRILKIIRNSDVIPSSYSCVFWNNQKWWLPKVKKTKLLLKWITTSFAERWKRFLKFCNTVTRQNCIRVKLIFFFGKAFQSCMWYQNMQIKTRPGDCTVDHLPRFLWVLLQEIPWQMSKYNSLQNCRLGSLFHKQNNRFFDIRTE